MMSGMKYVQQVGRDIFIHDGHFVELADFLDNCRDPVCVAVPKQFWVFDKRSKAMDMEELERHLRRKMKEGGAPVCNFKNIEHLKFNNLEVRTQDTGYYRHVDIKFYNPVTCGRSELELKVYYSTIGADYDLDADGSLLTHNSVFPMEYSFHPVSRLTSINIGPMRFAFGLSPNQYQVRYKGRVLNGKSYAMLFGAWGILLDDDLQFDSLVYLSRVSTDLLEVDKFGYSVNKYILKVMMLQK